MQSMQLDRLYSELRLPQTGETAGEIVRASHLLQASKLQKLRCFQIVTESCLEVDGIVW